MSIKSIRALSPSLSSPVWMSFLFYAMVSVLVLICHYFFISSLKTQKGLNSEGSVKVLWKSCNLSAHLTVVLCQRS